jgi:hypothetical protein
VNVPPADYTRTLAALTAIPALVETLEVELIDATASSEGTRTKPASRPPANPELMSDLEEAWGVLTTWARDWSDVYTFTAPMPYWDEVCGFLARHWPNTAETHPAAQEFADEIGGTGSWTTNRTETGPITVQSVWVRLSRHTLDEPREWQPILGRWRCPVIHPDADGNCDGPLMENMLQRVITCSRCGTTWTYDQYDKLGAMLGMEYTLTVEQASLVAKVSKRTIDRWINTEDLPLVPDERGRRMVDRRDLYALTTRRVTSA